MEKKPVSYFLVGIVLSLVSIILFLGYYFAGIAFDDNFLKWIPYLVPLALLIYFVMQYGRDTGYNSTFGTLFGYGFKACIIWTLITIAFTLLFIYIFPDYKVKALEMSRLSMDKQPNFTESQKDSWAKMFDDHFVLIIIAGVLLVDLPVGLIASLIGAFATKKNPVTPFN